MKPSVLRWSLVVIVLLLVIAGGLWITGWWPKLDSGIELSQRFGKVDNGSADDEKPFPLYTDAPPKQWKMDAINEGLPYRWEKGEVHLLAWEVIEDLSEARSTQTTQVLVLKRFHQPTKKGRHRWVLAQVYHSPNDKERAWHRDMLLIPPVPDEKMPKLTDAQVFGHEFFDELPTDEQIDVFLRQAGWRPQLGPHKAFALGAEKVETIDYVKSLANGGVDRALWKKLFERDVTTTLFPELQKATEAKK